MNSLTVAADAGITYRQMDHWIRRGYVRVAPTGSGYERDITDHEASVTKHMGTLTRAGIRCEDAARVARDLASGKDARIGPFRLVPEDAA